MRYAITPSGVGAQPGARAIPDDGAFAPGETFAVSEAEYNRDFVLALGERSLRPRTIAETGAEVKTEDTGNLKGRAINALIDGLLEAETLNPLAHQAIKDWDVARKA